MAILCRASIECAVYAAATVRDIKIDELPNNEGKHIYQHSWTEWKLTCKGFDFQCALDSAKRRGIINKEIEKLILDVREDGNFVAHLYTGFRKRLNNNMRKHYNPKANGKTNIIITESDAENDIRRTAKILSYVRNKVIENYTELT